MPNSNLFDEESKKLEKLMELVEEIKKEMDSAQDQDEQIKAVEKIANIDLGNEMEPADRMYPTVDEAKNEDKTVVKLEEALTKKFQELLDG